jgi:hypothetical protein
MSASLATVIAAVIAAVAAIFNSIWQGRKAKQSATDVKKLENATAQGTRMLQQELVERIGFSARSLAVVVEIINAEGDAKTTRTYTDVRLQAATTLGHLPHVEEVSGELEGETCLTRVSGPDGSRFPKQVGVRYNRINSQKAETVLTFPTGLTIDDPPLSYVLESRVKRGYFMTAEGLAAAYGDSAFPYEWHAISPGFPIDRITLDIYFPQGYPMPDCFPVVFIGDGELIHSQETDRIKAGITRRANGASLLVDEPLMGFRYLISWAPPPQAKIAKAGRP